MSRSLTPGHQVMQARRHMQQSLIWQGGRQESPEESWYTQTLRHSLDNNDGIQHDFIQSSSVSGTVQRQIMRLLQTRDM